MIREIHRQSRGTYGAPRVHADLRLGRDICVGRKRVERLMRTAGLVGVTRRRRKGCTRRAPDAVPSDDLVARQFRPLSPDRLWVADVTEHRADDGKVYLAVVIDAWSRLVVGWSIADHLRAELVIDAFDMAAWRRRPPKGQTIHHSDHGCQDYLGHSTIRVTSDRYGHLFPRARQELAAGLDAIFSGARASAASQPGSSDVVSSLTDSKGRRSPRR